FMKKHLGEEYTGVIIGMKADGLIVELDRYPVTGIVEAASFKDDQYEFMEQYMRFVGRYHGKIFQLTDQIKVMVSRVDDDIYFSIS
ncbi:MAG TPA: S1 RNA-binding domain-containing protein, partial [Candidatus Cloacimonadota bacterium]|nr:S1 RNA-binding domain-containing protein [Candidatus Cloacimonadota bacterium]